MSYDVQIGEHQFNYTYNLGKLWHDFMPMGDNGQGGLHGLDGMTGRQAAEHLRQFFVAVNAARRDRWNQQTHRTKRLGIDYDAENGWGDVEGALIFSALLMAACRENKKKTVSVG